MEFPQVDTATQASSQHPHMETEDLTERSFAKLNSFAKMEAQAPPQAEMEQMNVMDAVDKQIARAEDARALSRLQARDRYVKTAEQAHARKGGQYVKSPQYRYVTGPDGKKYAVAGKVEIKKKAPRLFTQSNPKEDLKRAKTLAVAAAADPNMSWADYVEWSRAVSDANAARIRMWADSPLYEVREVDTSV